MNCLLERILLCFSMLPDADDGFDVFFFCCRMWGNRIGDEGAEAFAEALRHHPRLTNLRWEGSYYKYSKNLLIQPHWVNSRFAFLGSKSLSQWHHIWRREVPGRSTENEQHPQDILVGMPLSLSQMMLFSQCYSLYRRTRLCCCRLVQNELTDDAAAHLAELVQANTGLTHLW